MGADERDGVSVFANEVQARTEDLAQFFQSGDSYVSRLNWIFDDVVSNRSRAMAAFGSSEGTPTIRVAKPDYSGNFDPFAELIAEARNNNGFVQEVHDALRLLTASNGVTTASSYTVTRALNNAGFQLGGTDLSLRDDQALADNLEREAARDEIRLDLDAVLGPGLDENEPGFLDIEELGENFETYMDTVAAADPHQQQLVAEVLVEYGIDLQAQIDDEDFRSEYRRTASALFVNQGIGLLDDNQLGDLVDNLNGQRLETATGANRPAIELLVDALDLDEDLPYLHDYATAITYTTWQGDNQPYYRHLNLTRLIEATLGADSTISPGGQRLVNYTLDEYPGVVETSDDVYLHPAGDWDRTAPEFDLRATLATALAAPNYGLTDGQYEMTGRIDEIDAALESATGAEFDQLWLERRVLISELVGNDDEAAQLVNEAMVRGLPAAEAARLANFASVTGQTNDRVRRIRVVYETTPFGQPVAPNDLQNLNVSDGIAQSLMVELGVLQTVQEARFNEGKIEPDVPLTPEQIQLVSEFGEVSTWFYHRFAGAFPGGIEPALEFVAEGQAGDAIWDMPEGFEDLARELMAPENAIIWELMAGASDNDTFLRPDGTYRPNEGRDYVNSSDPRALVVQMLLLAKLGPHHAALDGNGSGTIHEDEVDDWLRENRNNPSIPPALIDQIEAGRSFGLGEDTFGWDEFGELIGWVGLAAAATATIVYSGGTAAPLWVQAGLVGLAGLEVFAFVQADDPFNAVVAGLGGAGDLITAARLINRTRVTIGSVDARFGSQVADQAQVELVELAARSDIRALRDLAAEADELTPEQFFHRYENILESNQAALARELIDEGGTPAEVARLLDDAGITPATNDPIRVINLGAGDIEVRRSPGPRANATNLEANTMYTRNDYYFVTDEHGRPVVAQGNLELKSGYRTAEQTRTGNLAEAWAEDEGGHLIGAQFNGPTDAFNLVPQLQSLNRGTGSQWVAMETEWADALRAGSEVEVTIKPTYISGSASVRPDSFEVIWTIDGIPDKRSFPNT